MLGGNDNHIQVLNQDLTFSHSITTYRSTQAKSTAIHNMAVDSQGVAYVTDSLAHCVRKFFISGQFIEEFGSLGKEERRLVAPVGIAIDHNDYAHVTQPRLQ